MKKKILLCVFSFTFLPFIFTNASDMGVVTGNNVRIRSEASIKSSIINELFKGNKVQILEETVGESVQGSTKWYKICLPYMEEQTGFIHSNFIAVGKAGENYLKTFNRNQFDGMLKEIFSSKQIKAIQEYDQSYQNIKTPQDLEKVFRLGNKNMQTLSDALDKAYQEKVKTGGSNQGIFGTSWLCHYLPAHIAILVAEGTMLNFTYILGDLLEKAKQTPGKTDDEFFQLLINIYGNIDYSHPSWFTMKWDYGGDSLLGTGVHLKFLKEIQRLTASGNLFHPELLELQEKILNDIQSSLNYSEKREEIIKEIQQILGQIPLSAEQKSKLQNRLKEFQDPKTPVNTNCKDPENSKCTYG